MEKEELFKTQEVKIEKESRVSTEEIKSHLLGKSAEERDKYLFERALRRIFGIEKEDKVLSLAPQLSEKDIKTISSHRNYEDLKFKGGKRYEFDIESAISSIKYALGEARHWRDSRRPEPAKTRKWHKELIYRKLAYDALANERAFEKSKHEKDLWEKSDKEGKIRTFVYFVDNLDYANYFRLAFESFFEPIFKHKEIKQKFEELSFRKKELGQRYQSVAQNPFLIKSEKKQRWAEIQEELSKIKPELNPLEDALKAREILINNFIPDYKEGEEPKPFLEKMYDKFSKKFKQEHS